jgi:hypothetical protein
MALIILQPYQSTNSNDAMITRLESVGTVQTGTGVTQSADSKTGNTSFNFDGTSNAYIKVGSASEMPPEYDLDTSDYTIEVWLKPRDTAVSIVCGNLYNQSGTGRYWVTLNNTFQGFATVAFGNMNITPRFGTTPFPINIWSHLALSCSGGTLRCFLNGKQIGPSIANPISSGIKTNQYMIGSSSDTQFTYNGLMDDLQIIEGVGKYTTDFTPVS